MKSMTLTALALVLTLAAGGAATAQVPSGGPDAKGNAPLKHGHTVNDGVAKPGRTSFTMKQAQRHIEHAGYTAVTGLTKGDDGVWRGRATKDGSARDIGLDFKGNVSEGGAMAMDASSKTMTTTTASSPMPMTGATPPAAKTDTATASTTTMKAKRHARRHHRRHHAMRGRCAKTAPNGAACSGIDRNMNGISDKEDRAMKAAKS